MSKNFIQNVSVSAKGKNTDRLSFDGSTTHLVVNCNSLGHIHCNDGIQY